jgi:hypothetical protein
MLQNSLSEEGHWLSITRHICALRYSLPATHNVPIPDIHHVEQQPSICINRPSAYDSFIHRHTSTAADLNSLYCII